jgi:general secretion pathway protein J
MKIAASQGASRSRGYTLIEVLISVSVFAVLSGSVYLALSAMADAAFVQRERSAALAELQLSVARLDSDLRQLVSRPVRVAEGGVAPALRGDSTGFEATRAGWGNPADQRRSQLQRFGWRRSGEVLQRQFHLVTDGISSASAQTEDVLAGVQAFEIEYRARNGRWLDQWPPGLDPGLLPTAVRYRLYRSEFGAVERTIVL